MPRTVIENILAEHLVEGEPKPGCEVGLRIDQTLTQDATGTTAYLLLEAMDIPRVRTEVSVSYVDHNMAQFGPENHNDHLYLQSIARKLGVYFSRPGNGICHQVHFERFAAPGKTLLGSDSHTPTAGGMGCVSIGAGGLDVAVAMGGGAFYTLWPRIIGVELKGSLQPWVGAKDIILKLLSILTTRGNVGGMVEYFGEGVATLRAPARATVTNMGAELGVTTSVFPSDEVTREFLAAQGREEAYRPLIADAGATYGPINKRLHAENDADAIENIRRYATDVSVGEPDAQGYVEVSFGHIVLDLSQLEPLAAGTPSPDNIHRLADLAGQEVRQVLIGSCTNSSYEDLMRVAEVLRGRTVHPKVELGIAPGSRQVLAMLSRNGALAEMIQAGARIIESACGPCIGQGFSPAEGTVSLRTFNRNFAGRSGTKNDMVYLVSPESAVAAALLGKIADPRELAKADVVYPAVEAPREFLTDDGMIQPPLPPQEASGADVVRPSTIVKPPAGDRLPEPLRGRVAIRVGDKITTDHIMPAGSLLKYRSNVPQYAQYVFDCFNEPGHETFAQRAQQAQQEGLAAVIVAGDSYGQGSSREHAALCPMYLGVRVVLAKAIERIHQANLVNFAILPLVFDEPNDYDRIRQDDVLIVENVTAAVAEADSVTVRNETRDESYACRVQLAPRQRKILAAGGLLNYTREHAAG